MKTNKLFKSNDMKIAKYKKNHTLKYGKYAIHLICLWPKKCTE